MELGLAGKTVIVTGGASNIGRAISLAFAREGSRVVIADLDKEQGDRVAAEAESLGADKVVATTTDVTDLGAVTRMIETAEEKCGPVHILINNVGWTRERLFTEKPRHEWEKEIQVNLWSMINCTRAVLDGMISRRAGAVVSIGSDAGRMGEYREGVYAACKAGVMALSKTLARENGRYGIRFNVVCPGAVIPEEDEEYGEYSLWREPELRQWTTPEMRERIAKAYPLRRVGTADEVANAVVFLASDAASFITGQTLSVSGGYTMM